MSRSRDDLKADLLSDLRGEAAARPMPSPLPVPPPVEEPRRTPSLDVRLTPLHWSLPRVRPSEAGFGLGLRVGPLQVDVEIA